MQTALSSTYQFQEYWLQQLLGASDLLEFSPFINVRAHILKFIICIHTYIPNILITPNITYQSDEKSSIKKIYYTQANNNLRKSPGSLLVIWNSDPKFLQTAILLSYKLVNLCLFYMWRKEQKCMKII